MLLTGKLVAAAKTCQLHHLCGALVLYPGVVVGLIRNFYRAGGRQLYRIEVPCSRIIGGMGAVPSVDARLHRIRIIGIGKTGGIGRLVFIVAPPIVCIVVVAGVIDMIVEHIGVLASFVIAVI